MQFEWRVPENGVLSGLRPLNTPFSEPLILQLCDSYNYGFLFGSLPGCDDRSSNHVTRFL